MKKHYRWIILFSGALAFVVSNAFTLFQDGFSNVGNKLLYLLAVAFSIVLHFSCLMAMSVWVQWQYPEVHQTRRRIVQALATGIPLAAILMLCTDAWQQHLRGETITAFRLMPAAASIAQAVAIGILVVGLSEALFHYELLVRSEQEKKELMRLNLMAQYDSLKQQVNPHFLFNSLNSLASLIHADARKAEDFVAEMSHVYRYLLQSNRVEMASLRDELGFLRSYLHLLSTRFGEALQPRIDVAEHWEHCPIPPLTLQLLVENAVKHNEVSSEKPLALDIFVQHNQLCVRNNLQRKTTSIPSDKIGLANIMARYRMAGFPDVEVEESGNAFEVRLEDARGCTQGKGKQNLFFHGKVTGW